jgi:hypothetical protein
LHAKKAREEGLKMDCRSLILATLPLLASSAVADVDSTGERVRLTLAETRRPAGAASAGVVTGRLLELTEASAIVITREGAAPTTVSRTALKRVERSLGRRSRGAGFGRGFLIGLGTGIVSGGLTGLALGSDRPRPGAWLDIRFSAKEKAAILGTICGLAGSVLGGVIGAVAPGERWVEVPQGRLQLQLAPRPGGGAVALSLRF